ncbi:hypothetical protein TESG_05113 [Trichophyton tonsurans CBS 112818]|uniref:DUF7924 domain-containing protein n=1 Tax=Trichophyton tonsurans (strain CBS 112818) TaxID=647933 RepID=F2S2B3_TRIT1|nr:hypothetical protein TESG_05113 [Trichophyton tonsurans CBS 112818]
MLQHQMLRSSDRLKYQTEKVTRKREAPEDTEKYTERVKIKPQPTLYRTHPPVLKDTPPCTHTQDLTSKHNHKRPCEDQSLPSPKRPRSFNPASSLEHPVIEYSIYTTSAESDGLIRYWCEHKSWPKEYFVQQVAPTKDMSYPLARKRSSASLHRKSSNSSLATGSNTPADRESRNGKSAKYWSPSYETVLATKGSFMRKSDLGITEKSKLLCKDLLESDQPIPEHTLFRDDTFDEVCQRLQGKNESRVIQDISRLIVPSVETLAVDGAENLKHLVESVNERWGSSIAFYGPLPQPDYAVAFDRSAFTDDQLKKFEPFLGYDPDTYSSFFLGTFYMYFPFLTCEVKGTAALDIADRQNAHSMTLAVRGVVELLRYVGRGDEVNREILAFSLSHDHRTVRIYGHYPVIDGDKISFYRHPIRTFDFTELEGRDKWTTYKFTRNVYEKWAPEHLQRIRSAIDEIPPGVNFSISNSAPDLPQPSTPPVVDEDEVTSNTSFTRQTQILKRPRNH